MFRFQQKVNKRLKRYGTTANYTHVEQEFDGYLISSVIELPGCHTQAKTNDELYARTKEAIELYLEENNKFKPGNRFVSLQQISV